MAILKTKSATGFTLIEMLIYIAILTLVTGGALTVLFNLSDHLNSSRSERLLANSAQTALERMLTEIRIGGTVDRPNSTLDTSPGELEFDQPGTTTINFLLSGGTVVGYRDGDSLGSFTDEDVIVDELIFHHYQNTSTEMVGIELGLTAVVGDATTTRTFNAAAVLRGSYD